MEKLKYKGWKNCYRISNDYLKIIITGDIGPRIISLSGKDGENIFKEYDQMLGKTGGNEWRIYGGHRLWIAPENPQKTYFPDNNPVEIEQYDILSYNIKSPIENTTGLEKNIYIELLKGKPSIRVKHRIYNRNQFKESYSVWALTVMKQGGNAIIPLPPKKEHNMENLLPISSITIWSYTDISDSRFIWGNKYITINQKSVSYNPQKIGIYNTEGWFAYHINDKLFIKKFNFVNSNNYPDFNSNNEFFTNRDMLELETLTPIQEVNPNDFLENVEEWSLYENVPKPSNEDEIEDIVKKYVKN